MYDSRQSFDQADNLQLGYGKVLLNGKFGLLNENGMEVIPCQYEDFYIGKNGLITVKDKFSIGLVQLRTNHK